MTQRDSRLNPRSLDVERASQRMLKGALIGFFKFSCQVRNANLGSYIIVLRAALHLYGGWLFLRQRGSDLPGAL